MPDKYIKDSMKYPRVEPSVRTHKGTVGKKHSKSKKGKKKK